MLQINRKTAEFALESEIGKALWIWVQNVAFPEEIFFNTLVRIDKKSFKNYKVKQSKNPRLSKLLSFLNKLKFSVVDKRRDFTHGLCTRRTLWYFNRRNCFGVMKRHLCNLDLRDLPEVYEKKCLFINKFDLAVDARIVACLHEFLTMK